jgi:hypothetical protein
MSLGTYLKYEKSILGCWLGWTVKNVWAYYEQLLRPVFSSFYEQKINLNFFENIVGFALKSCID